MTINWEPLGGKPGTTSAVVAMSSPAPVVLPPADSEDVTHEHLSQLAERLSAKPSEALQKIGHALGCALRGESFASKGERNAVAFQLSGELMRAFPFADASVIAEHLRLSIEATGEPTVAAFVNQLERHRPNKQSEDARNQELLEIANSVTPPSPANSATFDPARFGGELRDLASRCRKKDLKPYLEALCEGRAFDPNAAPQIAAKLATEFRHYRASDVASGITFALSASGITAEHFAAEIEKAAEALPKPIDFSQDWAQGLVRNDESKVLPSLVNVMHTLRAHPEVRGRLAFDLLRQNVVFAIGDRPQVWTDQFTTEIRAWMIEQIGAEVKRQDVIDSVNAVARANASHPVQIYLSGLIWDGTPRADAWLTAYCGAEDRTYTRAIGAKWLLSAVARAFDPGCKVDTMLILQGAQGIGKSTAFATLVPNPDWFSDSPLDFDHPERSALSLFGKWIYEIGELQGFAKADANRLKGFMSSRSDNVRAPYASRNEEFPRGCVFGGSTNAEQYLTDETGNRRFWPVSVGACDVTGLGRDRDQLWAEAVARYRAGEPWWLNAEIESLAKVEQDARYVADVWESAIRGWLEDPRRRSDLAGVATEERLDLSGGVTTGEVLFHALNVPVGQQDRAKATRVGQTLRKLGWSTKRGSDGARRYLQPPTHPTHPTGSPMIP